MKGMLYANKKQIKRKKMDEYLVVNLPYQKAKKASYFNDFLMAQLFSKNGNSSKWYHIKNSFFISATYLVRFF